MSWQHQGPDLPEATAREPETLASDAERDAAAGLLAEALAEGRLTADEHDERIRAALASRTWPELARLTADLPAPADAAGPTVTGPPDGPGRCLMCALLTCCPPAGIVWLLASRRRARVVSRQAGTGPRGPGWRGQAAPAGGGPGAEDR